MDWRVASLSIVKVFVTMIFLVSNRVLSALKLYDKNKNHPQLSVDKCWVSSCV